MVHNCQDLDIEKLLEAIGTNIDGTNLFVTELKAENTELKAENTKLKKELKAALGNRQQSCLSYMETWSKTYDNSLK